MSEFTDEDYYDVCLNGSHHVIRCIERVEILFKYPVDNFNSHKSGGWNVYMFCLDNLKWKVIDPKDTAYNSGMQKYQVNYIEVLFNKKVFIIKSTKHITFTDESPNQKSRRHSSLPGFCNTSSI